MSMLRLIEGCHGLPAKATLESLSLSLSHGIPAVEHHDEDHDDHRDDHQHQGPIGVPAWRMPVENQRA